MGLSGEEAPVPVPVAALAPGSAELPLLDEPPVAPGALFCAEEHTAHAKTITAQDICLCHRIWPPKNRACAPGTTSYYSPFGGQEKMLSPKAPCS